MRDGRLTVSFVGKFLGIEAGGTHGVGYCVGVGVAVDAGHSCREIDAYIVDAFDRGDRALDRGAAVFGNSYL